MNIDILRRPTALENLLAGRIWPAGRRLPMHALIQITLKNTHLIFFFRSKQIFVGLRAFKSV